MNDTEVIGGSALVSTDELLGTNEELIDVSLGELSVPDEVRLTNELLGIVVPDEKPVETVEMSSVDVSVEPLAADEMLGLSDELLVAGELVAMMDEEGIPAVDEAPSDALLLSESLVDRLVVTSEVVTELAVDVSCTDDVG